MLCHHRLELAAVRAGRRPYREWCVLPALSLETPEAVLAL